MTHYIFYCGQESLRGNGVALRVNRRVRNAALGCILKNERMISVRFQGKPFNTTVIQVCALPGAGGEELHSWQRSWGRRIGIHKGRIEPQEFPWKFSSIYPQNQSLPTFCFVLSPTPLTLQGAVPHYLSLKKKKRVNLQLQLIKFLGVIVFQPTNSFGSPLACLNRFFRPHVIAQSLPTVRGRRCSKLSKHRFLWVVKRLIRNCIGEGFFTYWANVCY